jgi:pimeloyl-ACP methyl ester carboxylesterase
VLVLHGDQDTTAPLDGIRRLASRRPGWTLQVLPGIDHHPLLRDPGGCRRAIAAFVRDISAGPAVGG